MNKMGLRLYPEGQILDNTGSLSESWIRLAVQLFTKWLLFGTLTEPV